jgi:hypothetical protein
MFSKLSIINDRLLVNGQRTVNVEDDGSDEWNICSAAYEHGVRHLIQEHDWKFGTTIRNLSRTGDSPDENYEDAYARPAGALHIVWVRLAGVACDYRIVGNKILLSDAGGDVTAKIILEPGPEEWPPMFVSALNCLIDSGIARGLMKDAVEATRREAAADVYLQRARTRVDQQEPKRALFSTRLRTARLTRRV